MAYKDEYEVARLYTDGSFARRTRDTFEGDYKLKFHLAPPMFARATSDRHLQKKEYGAWMLPAFRLLATLKFLRGTAFDPFGRSAERKTERRLIEDYLRRSSSALGPQGRTDCAAGKTGAPARDDPRLRPHQGSEHRQGDSRESSS